MVLPSESFTLLPSFLRMLLPSHRLEPAVLVLVLSLLGMNFVYKLVSLTRLYSLPTPEPVNGQPSLPVEHASSY